MRREPRHEWRGYPHGVPGGTPERRSNGTDRREGLSYHCILWHQTDNGTPRRVCRNYGQAPRRPVRTSYPAAAGRWRAVWLTTTTRTATTASGKVVKKQVVRAREEITETISLGLEAVLFVAGAVRIPPGYAPAPAPRSRPQSRRDLGKSVFGRVLRTRPKTTLPISLGLEAVLFVAGAVRIPPGYAPAPAPRSRPQSRRDLATSISSRALTGLYGNGATGRSEGRGTVWSGGARR